MHKKFLERDLLICKLYVEGTTPTDLANRFHVCRARIHQILHKHKVTLRIRNSQNKRNRSAFTSHVKPGVKRALEREAQIEMTSVSELVATWVLAELKKRGATITELPSKEQDVPLPL